MHRILSLTLVVLLLAVSAAPVPAIDEDMVIVGGDVLVARPLGIVSTIIGGALFLVALPFAATSNTVKETAEVLIDEPLRFSFRRPVGDLSVGAGPRRPFVRQKRAPEAKTAPAEQTSPAGTSPEDSAGGGKPPGGK